MIDAPANVDSQSRSDCLFSLPDPRACRRLREIAQALATAHAEAVAKIDRRMEPPFDEGWQPAVKAAQDAYWAAVNVHLAEIARLTNNSASTLAFVFRPRRESMDLGGVTPGALMRLATRTGSWRR